MIYCLIFLFFSGPGVILFNPEPANIKSDSVTGNDGDNNSSGDYSTSSVHRMLLAAIVLTAILSSVLTIVALNYLSHRKYIHHHDKSPHYEYTPL